MHNSIAICITTHNRYEIFKHSYEQWQLYKPENADIFVVDDASTFPVPEANFRFNTNVGIAQAKNKCIALAEDYDFIFLVDDDVYPICQDWWVPYINSGQNHMSLSFEFNAKGERPTHSVYIIEKQDDKWIYGNPNGGLLFLTNKVIKTVGGMHPGFEKWSLEHSEYSRRIHNAGLTPYAYMDVPDGKQYFYIHDYYGSTDSSVPAEVRTECVRKNAKLYRQLKNSAEYIPYK